MDSILIIFAKEPVPGQVKTRLSPPLSPAQASDLYRCFMDDVLAEMGRLSGLDLALAMRLLGTPAPQPEYWDVENVPTLRQVYPARNGETISLTKLVGIATSRDTDAPLALAPDG